MSHVFLDCFSKRKKVEIRTKMRDYQVKNFPILISVHPRGGRARIKSNMKPHFLRLFYGILQPEKDDPALLAYSRKIKYPKDTPEKENVFNVTLSSSFKSLLPTYVKLY